MADEQKKLPTELVDDTNDIIDSAADKMELTPDQRIKAKEEFDKLKKGRMAVAELTRDALNNLSGEVKERTTTTMPTTEDMKVRQTVLIGLQALALEGFQEKVLKGSHDFAGDDDTLEKTRNNDTYKALVARMTKFANENTTVDWEPKYQSEWLNAVMAGMQEEISTFALVITPMVRTTDDIEKHLNRTLEKVGNFEQWFEKTYKDKPEFAEAKKNHDKLLDGRKELARQKREATRTLTAWDNDKDPLPILKTKAAEWKELDGLDAKGLQDRATAIAELAALAPKLKDGRDKAKKAADEAKFSGLKTRYEAISKAFVETTDSEEAYTKLNDELTSLDGAAEKITTMQGDVAAFFNNKFNKFPPVLFSDKLKADAEELKTKSAGSGGGDIDAIEGQIAALSTQVDALMPLKDAAVDASIPEAEREKVLAPLREGKITVAVAMAQFAQLKKTAEEAAVESAPFIDKIFAFVDNMEDGKWKKIFGGLLTSIAGGLAWIAKGPLGNMDLPFIGKVRGKLVSNRLLAEKYGDTKAAAHIKIENEFTQFGLPAELAASLDGMKTKDVVTEIKTKPNQDTAVQAKLEVLAGEIEKHGGTNNEVTLYEFMNSPVWTNIDYKVPAAVAAVAASLGTPGTAADASAKPAESGAKAPETVQTAEQQRLAKLNNELRKYQGKPIDPLVDKLAIDLPYVKEGKVETTPFRIEGNFIVIGSPGAEKKYKPNLPLESAKLQKIVFNGPVETGTVSITGGIGLLSSTLDPIPMSDLFVFFDKLRTGNGTQELSTRSGDKPIKLDFQPVA